MERTRSSPNRGKGTHGSRFHHVHHPTRRPHRNRWKGTTVSGHLFFYLNKSLNHSTTPDQTLERHKAASVWVPPPAGLRTEVH